MGRMECDSGRCSEATRLERIELRISGILERLEDGARVMDRLDKGLRGNGKPGLNQRMQRLELIVGAIVGVVSAAVVAWIRSKVSGL